jgi:hypothetical protein
MLHASQTLPILYVVIGVLALLLSISELLGRCQCRANSIYDLLEQYCCCHCYDCTTISEDPHPIPRIAKPSTEIFPL